MQVFVCVLAECYIRAAVDIKQTFTLLLLPLLPFLCFLFASQLVSPNSSSPPLSSACPLLTYPVCFFSSPSLLLLPVLSLPLRSPLPLSFHLPLFRSILKRISSCFASKLQQRGKKKIILKRCLSSSRHTLHNRALTMHRTANIVERAEERMQR